MRKYVLVISTVLLLYLFQNNAQGYLYILNDQCINDLYNSAVVFFKNTPITTVRDPRGIVLRYEFENIDEQFFSTNQQIYMQLEEFLAKIKNPVIIEVHTVKNSDNQVSNLRNWEVSTVIANCIESFITEPVGTVGRNRVHSVGYGEFLPYKNPPNNGGKVFNRVDIIILCNISGE